MLGQITANLSFYKLQFEIKSAPRISTARISSILHHLQTSSNQFKPFQTGATDFDQMIIIQPAKAPKIDKWVVFWCFGK